MSTKTPVPDIQLSRTHLLSGPVPLSKIHAESNLRAYAGGHHVSDPFFRRSIGERAPISSKNVPQQKP